jgi:ferric-dicitrate binding protein FerR (iron transport regulator)
MADSPTTITTAKEEADALQRKATATSALADAVKRFEDNWATLEPQAKAQLRECWNHDHQKAERRQLFWHCFWLGVFGVVWLWTLSALVHCLEGAISDIGQYGAVVLCVFLVISLSVPATLALFIIKRPRDDD